MPMFYYIINSTMSRNNIEKVLEIVRKKGVIRPRDLEKRGLHGEYLWQLYKRGLLDRVGRGLYIIKDSDHGAHQTLAEACKRVPHGVICLLSSLQYHGMTTQAPFAIWMAIDRKAWTPRIDRPVIRFVRFSGQALNSGVEEHKVEGVTVRVYSPAKTVADCFKYRNKIGLDVALEALRDCLRENKCNADELWRYGKICRVANVMRPYLETLS
jgi:predicted transcriptional regulator of viral defense system